MFSKLGNLDTCDWERASGEAMLFPRESADIATAGRRHVGLETIIMVTLFEFLICYNSCLPWDQPMYKPCTRLYRLSTKSNVFQARKLGHM